MAKMSGGLVLMRTFRHNDESKLDWYGIVMM